MRKILFSAILFFGLGMATHAVAQESEGAKNEVASKKKNRKQDKIEAKQARKQKKEASICFRALSVPQRPADPSVPF